MTEKNNIENIKKKRKIRKKLLKIKRIRKRMNYINNLSIIKFMSKIDDKLFLKVFKDNRSGYFKSFMKLMSRLGDGYVWAFLYFSIYMFRIKYAILYFARAAAAVFICIFVYKKFF